MIASSRITYSATSSLPSSSLGPSRTTRRPCSCADIQFVFRAECPGFVGPRRVDVQLAVPVLAALQSLDLLAQQLDETVRCTFWLLWSDGLLPSRLHLAWFGVTPPPPSSQAHHLVDADQQQPRVPPRRLRGGPCHVTRRPRPISLQAWMGLNPGPRSGAGGS